MLDQFRVRIVPADHIKNYAELDEDEAVIYLASDTPITTLQRIIEKMQPVMPGVLRVPILYALQ